MKKIPVICLFITLFILQDCFAQEGKRPEEYNTVTFYMENDVVRETDSQYTNGMKWTWISEDLSNYKDDDKVPEWAYPIIEILPFINKPGLQKNVSFSLGQNIYTPDDTEETAVIEDDRPYAGITYLAVGFISKNLYQMDTVEIDMGIIGPHSYAAEVQDKFHDWFDRDVPQGWDNQLKDEPVLNLFFERKWRTLSHELGDGYAYDIIPHAGFSVGNMMIAASAGGQVRFGLNLPNDFGTIQIRPGSDTNAPIDDNDPRFSSCRKPFGVHLFLGIDAYAVAKNILLDGNTFAESHSVDKEPVVCRFIGGVGFLFHRIKVTYSNVWETKNFKTQKEGQMFGSFTISYSY